MNNLWKLLDAIEFLLGEGRGIVSIHRFNYTNSPSEDRAFGIFYLSIFVLAALFIVILAVVE